MRYDAKPALGVHHPVADSKRLGLHPHSHLASRGVTGDNRVSAEHVRVVVLGDSGQA